MIKFPGNIRQHTFAHVKNINEIIEAYEMLQIDCDGFHICKIIIASF